MKKSLIILLCVLSVAACNKDEGTSRTQLLTNGSTKNWNLTATTPDDTSAGCGAGSDRAKDNSWAFSVDGSFEFNHGELTEEEGSNCSDFINLTGNWSFTDHESKLLITVSGTPQNPNSMDTDTLIFSTIKGLTSSSMVLTENDLEAVFSPK